MELDQQVAQKIVKRAMHIIPNSVNVMDKNGIIIASGDTSRLNQKHIGAVIAIRENRVVEVDELLSQKWNQEAKPGINIPINYLGKIFGVVGVSGHPEEVRPYAELVKMTAELIIEQYILIEQERWSHRYKEEFILQLVDNSQKYPLLAQQAHFFGIDLSLDYIVVLINLCHSNQNQLQELVNYLQQQNVLFAIHSLDSVLILFPASERQNKRLLKTLVPPHWNLRAYKIVVGGFLGGNEKLSLSYKTALSTLNYGLKFFPKKAVYFFEQCQLPVLLDDLTDSWQAKELLKPINKLYTQDTNQQLHKTLQQYFLSNCDLPLTAQNLFIHINTLRYRLNKIEQITSLSFNRIEDLFIFYLSILLKK
ncbi:helix-turn-helix domain-containing protein [Avibacterium sp. 20-15]|uniref:sugar diacid recognition domain-containing protein n=1 Tax=unclassified Avibacterium TaxID=2685287 RepID=UPI0020268503|nr:MULTISPECIES: sugar diacid recognition domain-containing protein [unclassified Avibacterium]MCW9733532.1 helix-turn-helix domain-containing protein [Avibacterium sp. 20-15]URL03391.1 helix-turn-helix domain-containing protein [Avibacterium sp. 20-132]